MKYEARVWKTDSCLGSFCSYSAGYVSRISWLKTPICWPDFYGMLTKQKNGFLKKVWKYPLVDDMLTRFLDDVDQILICFLDWKAWCKQGFKSVNISLIIICMATLRPTVKSKLKTGMYIVYIRVVQNRQSSFIRTSGWSMIKESRERTLLILS